MQDRPGAYDAKFGKRAGRPALIIPKTRPLKVGQRMLLGPPTGVFVIRSIGVIDARPQSLCLSRPPRGVTVKHSNPREVAKAGRARGGHTGSACLLKVPVVGKVWQQRIRHFDRALKPLEGLRLRKERRARALRERAGRPSRALPLELVFERLELRRSMGSISEGDFAERRAKLEFKQSRTRLLERKRDALAKIRSRRVSRESSGINCWRRRLDFLAEIEALRKRAAETEEGHHTP